MAHKSTYLQNLTSVDSMQHTRSIQSFQLRQRVPSGNRETPVCSLRSPRSSLAGMSTSAASHKLGTTVHLSWRTIQSMTPRGFDSVRGRFASTTCQSASDGAALPSDAAPSPITGSGESSYKEEDEDLAPLLRMSTTAAVWQVAWPSIFIGCLHALYGITDAHWIGHLGPSQLKAMGGVSFAVWILNVLCHCPGVGVHSLSSTAEGAGNREGVAEIIMQGLWLALGIVLLLAALAPFTHVYFDLLGLAAGSPERLAGQSFLRLSLLAAAPVAASEVIMAGFKGMGRMRPIMWLTIISVALNACLDPLLIWGWGPIPRLGIMGAACATSISALVATLLSAQALADEGYKLKFAWPKWSTQARLLQIGGPITAGGLLFSCVYLFLGRAVTGLGASNLAALGLGHRVENFAYTVCQGFSVGAATLVGQWLGAGNKRKAIEAASKANLMCGAAMLVGSVCTMVWVQQIISIFTADPTITQSAVGYLVANAAVFVFMGMEAVYEGAMTGAGNTLPAFLIGSALNLLRLPFALFLAYNMGMGVQGVWIAIAISTVLKSTLKMWWFNRQVMPGSQCGAEGSSACMVDLDELQPQQSADEGKR